LIDLLAQARATLYPLVSKSAHFHRVLGRRNGRLRPNFGFADNH
jgi:hypothetical protein